MSSPTPRFYDDDEEYVYQERLAILCGDATPTPEQIELAVADVKRFRNETAQD